MRQKMRQLGLLLAAVLLGASLSAQRNLSGTVTDAQTGEPLIGANILVKGTSTGTVTDFDGTYTLRAPEGAEQLVFSYTGYASQTIDIGSSDVIDVAMAAGEVLEEVVVIGYGTVRKEDATGSVETVTTESFNRGALTSPQELLAGKVAGVSITPEGTPGGGATIRIRGGSSLSASNDPLIVIDGVPVSNDNTAGQRNVLSLINPNDIETFTVLKDASATAIYGSRASNGVIIITTKKGKVGRKISVGYNGSVAFSNPASTVDVLEADDFRGLIEERFAEDHPARSLLGSENTDWQEEIYQTGVMHDHNLNFAGGVAGIPYRVTLGYTDQDGILKTDEFNRLTYGVNLSPGFFDNRLQIQAGLKGMRNTNHFADRGAIGSAIGFDPTQPVRDPESPYGGFFTWTQPNGNPITIAPANPLAMLEMRDDESTVNRYIANFTADYRFAFLPELRANLNLAYDEAVGEGTVVVPDNASFAFNDAGNGGVNNEYEQTDRNELLEFYLNYVKDFGNTQLDIMGGYSWQRFYRKNFDRRDDENGIRENTNEEEYYLISLFGRVNYSLFDRVLLTFTLRQDGSSRFAEGNRYGLFPAAAAAWKIIGPNNPVGKMNSLKLRLGYGVTGQQAVGGFYPSQATYLASLGTAQYQLGNQFLTTLRPEGYNADLKWEETTTYNIAVDYGFFDDRLNGSVEVYQRNTEDLLNFIPVPAGTNLSNFVDANVGDLENRGFEISVNAVPYKRAEAEWSFGLNFTRNVNEITRLTATEDPEYQGVATGGISGGVGNNIQIHSVGHPANSFYVFEQVYDESGMPIEDLYVDRNQDGIVNADDLYRFENPAPDAFLGFTSNFYYGDFDFSFAGRANLGNHVYNNNLSVLAEYSRLYNSTNYLSNVHSDIRAIDFGNPRFFSDFFVQDASFLRLDHVTVGYRFNDFLGPDSGSSIRVYGTVQNPFVITDYEGLDPEVFGGIDNNIYPRSRTILFGLNVNL